MRKSSPLSTLSAVFAFCLSSSGTHASDFSVGGAGATHASLAAAVEAAGLNAGADTITLAPGTYPGNLTITEPGLTLVGANAIISVASGAGIVIQASNV